MNDLDLALMRLRGLVGDQDPEQMMAFVHVGAPASKARARWNDKSRSFYTPQTTRDAQEALSIQFRQVMEKRGPFLGPVAIVAIFFRPNRQRIDADNMMKLVMDAGTKARVWRDDCQVAAQSSLVELDLERPRTVIALCPYLSTMDRTPLSFTCPRCGSPFERPEWYQRKSENMGRGLFCSMACARPSSLATATCPKCNQDFQRTTSGQRYCSVKCARQFANVRLPNGEQRPPKLCEKCGGPVSRREYKQCRACRGYGRPNGSLNKPVGTKGDDDAQAL